MHGNTCVVAEGEGQYCQWKYSPDGGETWHDSTNGTAQYATLSIGEVNEYLMGMAWRCKVMDGTNLVCSRAVYLKRNTTLWTNTYNSDGIRVSRSNRESTYNYTYLGGQLTKLTVDGHTMYFYYGADSAPMAMSFNGVRYYYVTSLQGDITAIVDQTGTVVTTYLYDAWGNILSVTGSLSATVGRYNPLRYRGYVYDRETKLYYLQSRYYNPEIGRFINADGYVSTGQGFEGNNMFVYCGNNPIVRIDMSGRGWLLIMGIAALGAAINVGTSWLVSWASGEEFAGHDIGVAAVCGAVGTFGPGGTIASGVLSGLASAYSTYQDSGDISDALVSGVVSLGATVLTVGNISTATGMGLEKGVEIFSETVFGIGSGFVVAGVDKMLQNNDPVSVGTNDTNKSTSVLGIIAKNNYIANIRIVDGQAIMLGSKNCSYPRYLLPD